MRLGFPPGSQPCLLAAPCPLPLPSRPCESMPGFHQWPGEPPHYAPEPDLMGEGFGRGMGQRRSKETQLDWEAESLGCYPTEAEPASPPQGPQSLPASPSPCSASWGWTDTNQLPTLCLTSTKKGAGPPRGPAPRGCPRSIRTFFFNQFISWS
ncbi:unnamed protein product [Rangifer tarandus platyrhynchus]|uniref:Uncharacterized protein n=2 Tax=Rangifer tarandus platyrhynchus TaxID=3082113 RepID=A0AC59Z0R5_RANTA|nr:unnamed protein product [Rangifer tarandus platyrhynchus]